MDGAGQGAVFSVSRRVEPQARKPHALLANNAYPAVPNTVPFLPILAHFNNGTDWAQIAQNRP